MSLDLKAQVLEASVRLIAEEGLAGLSMREVARRAGVSHQAPYHYFDDKAAIVAALVERGFTRLADRLEAASREGLASQRLARTGRAYVAFALDEPVYFRLMFRPELADRARFPAVEAAGARALGVLRRLVDESLGPRATPARREATVSMHWSLAHGLATLLLDGPLGASLAPGPARDRHVDEVLRLFVER
ncbi:MAG: TetR/AcrR family transcriptional regulator [Myxococcaceae bacterium]|nr:TetR/AcrR family transcriptional regulator [Myxococcaceae bacterium]